MTIDHPLRYASTPRTLAALRLVMSQMPQIALALYEATSMQLVLYSPRYAATAPPLDGPDGRTWTDSVWWTTPAEALQQWQIVVGGGALHQAELRVTASDGAVSIWDWSLTPIVEPGQQQPRYVLVAATDISAPVHAREQAALLDQLKDEFLLVVSHELRTPLTSVVGYTQLLASLLEPSGADGPSERIKRYLTTITTQLDRLTRLINDLADLGRLESGKFTIGRVELELRDLLRRAAEEALMLTSQQVALELPPDDAPLLVRGDRERLTQVLMNLIQNAISHAPQSERIELRLRQPRDATGLAQIDVQDYGPGIAPQDISALFDRFFQVTRQQRSPRGGLGLGLYICKQIIEQHGGTIAVDSTLGLGTTFHIQLPLVEASMHDN